MAYVYIIYYGAVAFVGVNIYFPDTYVPLQLLFSIILVLFFIPQTLDFKFLLPERFTLFHNPFSARRPSVLIREKLSFSMALLPRLLT